MAYIIGTDEAGYGPNLGPLVVAATLWQVPDADQQADLYDLLGDSVSRVAPLDGEADSKLAIADSKTLYRAGQSLHELERGVLAALRISGQCDETRIGWSGFCQVLDRCCGDQFAEVPWFREFDTSLPTAVHCEQVDRGRALLQQACDQAGVRLLKIQARVVCAGEFNQRLGESDSKGGLLSCTTLDLVQQMSEDLPNGPIRIECDKHGGRNKYVPLLQPRFPEYLIEVAKEGRSESRYRWGPADRRMEARFIAKGDNMLPSALASMTAKYLRELTMKAFNAYWKQHVIQLRPTAGYPSDAKRYKRDIATAQAKLGIDDEHLWRKK